jgi:cytochrome P450
MLGVMSNFGLTEEEMNATMVNALFAACEAPLHVLAAIVVELSKQPDLQNKLYSELTNKTPTGSKLLHNVVMEGLRLYAPVTIVQRRSIKILDIEGYYVPQNTNIGVCISALHANEEFFPNAQKFDPSRRLNHMMVTQNGFMPFSGGPRGCPGRHLAVSLLKSALGRIVLRFKLIESANSGERKIHKFVEFPSNGAYVNIQLRQQKISSRL